MTQTQPDDEPSRLLPYVSMVFPCVDVAGGLDPGADDLLDLKWDLKEPLTVVQLPEGGQFPFLVEQLYVYAHFTDGYGEFDLRVEMHRVLGSARVDPEGGITGGR